MSLTAATTTPAADNTAAPAEISETASLPPINSLLRFLYLSTNKHFYTKPRDIFLPNIPERLACVVTLGQARSILPISLIRKVSFYKILIIFNYQFENNIDQKIKVLWSNM